MILANGHSTQYLTDLTDGKIPMGLGLGCELDLHLRFKFQQLNFFLGHDNVGKSYFMKWYFLALATQHGLTFTLFMDEDYHGRVMRDLIQMYTAKDYRALTHKEVRRAEMKIESLFKFIDNSKRYEPKELTDIFLESKTDVLLIDPWNSMKTDLSYGTNYEVLNDLKMITKNENKTIYANLHPHSASGRQGAVYPKDHQWSGQVRLPMKSDAEGGKPFANKADDFVVVHRLTSHPDLWKMTMLEVVKVKDTDTGGKPTLFETPIMLDYNFGHGFLVGMEKRDVIRRPNPPTAKPLPEVKVDAVASFKPDFDNERQLPPKDRINYDVWDGINKSVGYGID